MTAALVSIIGPPAVGKTTLAEHLAAELPAELLYEDYAGNPFLREAYLGRDGFRLPCQLHFLMSRTKQLARPAWPERGTFVSDYGFCQDRLFAEAQLDAGDFALYDPIARRLERLIRPPDVLIHLDANVQALVERIARRGREHERGLTAPFLRRLRRAYQAVRPGPPTTLLRVDCDAVDLRRRGPRSDLLRRIREAL